MHRIAPSHTGPLIRGSLHKMVYRIEALPDREDPVYRVLAGGDVRPAILECHEHLLRTLTTYPAQSVGMTISWHFQPTDEPALRQTRLSIEIETWARTEEGANALRALIECSDLGVYYGLRSDGQEDSPTPPPGACCHITRIEQAIRPLHPPELNPAIPPCYYLVRPFEPRPDNDYLALDRILDRVAERVILEIAVEPTDVSAEQFLHTQYLARLQSINRFHGSDDEDGCRDPFEPDTYRRSDQPIIIQPLRRRDPIADDILSNQRRFHESLGRPHLAFRLSVRAETPAIAQLVASAAAESAFRDGSYQLWSLSAGPEEPEPPMSVPTLDRIMQEHATVYDGFRRLAHVATVNELRGAFTLPVGSRSSLRCSRKNTEPPTVPREQLLVFGHDE